MNVAEVFLGKPPPNTFKSDGRGVESRIDLFMLSENVTEQGFAQMDAPFSDHVVLIGCVSDNIQRLNGKGVWKLNLSLLKDKRARKVFKNAYDRWRVKKEDIVNILMCWDWVRGRIKKVL